MENLQRLSRAGRFADHVRAIGADHHLVGQCQIGEQRVCTGTVPKYCAARTFEVSEALRQGCRCAPRGRHHQRCPGRQSLLQSCDQPLDIVFGEAVMAAVAARKDRNTWVPKHPEIIRRIRTQCFQHAQVDAVWCRNGAKDIPICWSVMDLHDEKVSSVASDTGVLEEDG